MRSGAGGGWSSAHQNALARRAMTAADPALASQVEIGLREHVIATTRSSYGTAARSFVDFCKLRGVRIWPVVAFTFCAWLHVVVLSVDVASLGMYTAGIKYHQELLDMPWTLTGNELVRRTMRYLKKKFPSKQGPAKMPVTVRVLMCILPLLPGWPRLEWMSENDRVFATASVLAVAGFLRGGEFTTSSSSARAVLSFSAVSVRRLVSKLAVIVAVPQPKAMFWLESQDVACFAAPEDDDDTFCPVRLWETYVTLSPRVFKPSSPAFRMNDGKALSKAFMLRRTAQLVDLAGLTFVDAAGTWQVVKASSWRAGAVRSALDARVAPPFIMAMGRWKSQAWIKYVVDRGLDLHQTSQLMWAPVQAPAATHQRGAVVEMFDPSSVLVSESDAELARQFEKSVFM